MDDVNGIIARNIKNMRHEKRLSQGKLADMIGCSLGTVYDWERGKYAPSTIYLPAMADVFGCTIDALFGR